jgi:hypothetical protein
MKKAFISLAYLVAILRIASIPLTDLYFHNIFITPLFTLFILPSFASFQDFSGLLGVILKYSFWALWGTLLICWIIIIITMFLGLVSIKARKIFLSLSLFTAITDFLLILWILSAGLNNNSNLTPDYLTGVIWALCIIVINVICLIVTKKRDTYSAD